MVSELGNVEILVMFDDDSWYSWLCCVLCSISCNGVFFVSVGRVINVNS